MSDAQVKDALEAFARVLAAIPKAKRALVFNDAAQAEVVIRWAALALPLLQDAGQVLLGEEAPDRELGHRIKNTVMA